MTPSILIVEDSNDWRTMIAGLIQDRYPSVAVVMASSLSEARDHLLQQHFDLAVLDIRLDERDERNIEGLVLMDEISHSYSSTDILIVTAYQDTETVQHAMQSDASGRRKAVDYIPKASLHEILPKRVQYLIEGR